jgi:DNA-binding NtrC family response regulator
MDVLKRYHWPGNVRELRNVVESMLVIERGHPITADDVRRYLKGYQEASGDRHLPVLLPRNVEQAERELILRALLDIKGNLLDLKTMLTEREDKQGPSGDHLHVRHGAVQPTLSLVDMERRMITDALQRYNNNRRLAARALQISERTLYRKIKEYGLA